MKNPNKKPLGGRIKASFQTRAWHVGIYSVFAAVIVIAIAVVINLAVKALPTSSTQLDMTSEKLYSISDQTVQVLSSLDKQVDIYWIVQDGNQDSTLQQVLGKYAEYKNITVTQVDPVKYPNFASKYTSDTVSNNSLVVACGDRNMYIANSDIWSMSDTAYQNYYSTGQASPDTFEGEAKLTSAIQYVTSEEQPIAYTLSGHGESGLSDDMKSAVSLENVQVKDLSLLTVDAVPDDCGMLFLCGPTSDLSANEVQSIETYLNKGGKILITTAYTKADMTNFQKLLSDYGLELDYGYVFETDSNHYCYNYADLLLPDIGSHAITTPLVNGNYYVLMPDAQGLKVSDSYPTDLTVTSLLTTSDGAYLKANVDNATTYAKESGDTDGPFVLGAAVQNSTTGAQLVVFTSSGFMESKYSDLVSGANKDLFLNSVDWMCQINNSISIHAKTVSTDSFTFSNTNAYLVRIVFLALIPLAFIGTGVIIFVRRRRR